MKKILLAILAIVCAITSLAQDKQACWIAVPGSSANGYGVYIFRKVISPASNSSVRDGKDITSIKSKEKEKRIRVSADNHYKLFVNGKIVSIGPARSDIKHWNYDEIDLAPYLHEGDNTIIAKVWNEGPHHCQATMTYRTGFYMQAVDDVVSELNTNVDWDCIEDKSYSPVKVKTTGWYIAGPAERVDMHRYISSENGNWQKAKVINKANFIGQSGKDGTYTGWMMKRSELPQRELKLERLAEVRFSDNVKASKNFLQGTAPISIPANTKAQLVLDNRTLTNAYVTLNMSGGDNSKISLGYCESMFESLKPDTKGKGTPIKGNRNEINGKVFEGRTDTVISNGQQNQEFTSLYWRTYRYIVVNVTTADTPVTINDIYGTYTGFPFELKAKLNIPNRKGWGGSLQQIFDVGWRTARLCAVENYMDCPYYEQMQYFGDSRIQALVSLYMTGDDRLVKQLINAADWSRSSDGVTQSRYPSSAEQWIQTYALSYIYTLHDYMMYGGDLEFLKDKLMSERDIIEYFHHYQTADGRIKNLPGWNFTDWVFDCEGWKDGTAIPGADGSSSVLDLQLLYAYQMAADLEREIGMQAYAELYKQRAEQLKATIIDRYWRSDKGLISDRSDKEVFSQHANALAILTGVIASSASINVARHIENDVSLAPASIYFKFYTHEAMTKAGLGDDYLDWLGIWREYLKLGLTTWGEDSNVSSTRSDCHAWGASPNIELFRTVLGIDSDAPGFKRVLITPHLGRLEKIGGKMPSSNGDITVQYQTKGKDIQATVTLPENVTGKFMWNGRKYQLQGGKNVIDTAK